MAEKKFVPYVPAETTMPELTVKALFLGVVMAIVLGAANAYLGMKVGLTVAATFPAAVVAMAALRIFKGNILEENLARTTASVGESLVAGAIFTIPAFLICRRVDRVQPPRCHAHHGHRRRARGALRDHPAAPAGGGSRSAVSRERGGGGDRQGRPEGPDRRRSGLRRHGHRGAVGVLQERRRASSSSRTRPSTSSTSAARRSRFWGGRSSTPAACCCRRPEASPMVMGVGFIVGLRISAVLFCGAVTGWLVLVPLAIFLNPGLADASAPTPDSPIWPWDVWFRQIRPLAVGTMIVSAFYTLYSLARARSSTASRRRSPRSGPVAPRPTPSAPSRTSTSSGCWWRSASWRFRCSSSTATSPASTGGAAVLTVVMLVLGFLFAAVAGYLVGLVGNSNNPISGLTLSRAGHLGAADGADGSHRRARCGRGARCRRGRVLRRRRRRRHDAGLQGRPHPRRYAVADAGRRDHRRGRRRHRPAGPADGAQPGLHHRVGGTAGAAGRV